MSEIVEAPKVRITVVAAGGAGDRIAARIGQILPSVQCLPDCTPLPVVADAICPAELVLLVTGCEKKGVATRAAALADMVQESRSCKLSLAFVTMSYRPYSGVAAEFFETFKAKLDASFEVSSLLPDERLWTVAEDLTHLGPTVEEYRAVLACVDVIRFSIGSGIPVTTFQEVQSMFRSGGAPGRVGIAAGQVRGAWGPGRAAKEALRTLGLEGLYPGEAGVLLVSITAEPQKMTRDLLVQVREAVRNSVDDKAEILCGQFSEEGLDEHVRVVVTAKGWSAGSS